MDLSEFKKRRGQVQKVIWNAIILYRIWKELRYVDDPDEVAGMNRLKGFFVPVRAALFSSWVIEFVKLFDTDIRANSLDRLVSAAVKDPAALTPRLTESEVKDLARRMRPHRPTVETLSTVRQRVAHSDISRGEPELEETTGLTLAEVDALAEELPRLFNALSGAHDGQVWSFDYQPGRSAWETGELRRIMREERARGQERIDAANAAAQDFPDPESPDN